MMISRMIVAIVTLLVVAGDVAAQKAGPDPLRVAISRGDVAAVSRMLADDPDAADGPGGDVLPPLIVAVQYGHADIVLALLEAGADPNQQASKRSAWTALTQAVDADRPALVRLLVERGADPDLNGPLARAIHVRSRAIVDLLLDAGADVNAEPPYAPLAAAAERGDAEFAKVLLDRGADVSAPAGYGNRPITLAAGARSLELVELLIERGADVVTADGRGRTPTDHAVRTGHDAILRALVDAGAPTDALALAALGRIDALRDVPSDRLVDANDPMHPVHAAAAFGHTNVVEMLLDDGRASIDAAAPETLLTPLHLAIANGRADVVETLLARGADIEGADSMGRTALHHAVRRGDAATAARLLESGANADAVMAGSLYVGAYATPLRLAVTADDEALVRLLIDHGAAVNETVWNDGILAGRHLRDGRHQSLSPAIAAVLREAGARDDATPCLAGCVNLGDVAAARTLIAAGLDPTVADGQGSTLLHGAVRRADLEMITLLVESGAAVDAEARYAGTPLDVAIDQRRPDVVKHLMTISGVDAAEIARKRHAAQQKVIDRITSLGGTTMVTLGGTSRLRYVDESLDVDEWLAAGIVPEVVEVGLGGSDANDADVALLAALPFLQQVNLSQTGVTDVRPLATLEHLERVVLNSTAIDDEDVRWLAGLPNLRQLFVGNTRITDDGVRALTGVQLENLNLQYTDIGDGALEHLATLPELRHVWIDGTETTHSARQRFRDARPSCQLMPTP